MNAEKVDLEPRTMMGVHEVIPITAMVDYFGRAFTTSAAELGKQGAYPAGPAIALYHGKPTDIVDVTAGFPVEQPVTSTPEASVVTLPGGPAIQTVHTGSYDSMTGTYDELMAWVTEKDLTMSEDMWEEYLTGPESDPDPSTWTTRIVRPLA
ncbi:GyrI-like domain-containing protein [Cryobacterium sp. Sr8]|uniref:GyrI-like domain-containing protein n=1 Tax=Cryobacterium sp. Sr8 TaxID=1259203 RepID=UPI00141AE949|nr:GyrI-like domain-containing protein [Cryobacterium sp. Sr8]